MNLIKEHNKRRDILIYVSGKFTDENKDAEARNIELAMQATETLRKAGFSVFCPHRNGWYIDGLEYGDYLDEDLVIMRRCDCILMLPNWHYSNGAKIEHDEAKRTMPVFYDIQEILKNY